MLSREASRLAASQREHSSLTCQERVVWLCHQKLIRTTRTLASPTDLLPSVLHHSATHPVPGSLPAAKPEAFHWSASRASVQSCILMADPHSNPPLNSSGRSHSRCPRIQQCLSRRGYNNPCDRSHAMSNPWTPTMR